MSTIITIPTYNRAGLLNRAIRSVVTQTSKDWKLLVVDDGSNDNTPELLHGYNEQKIFYIRRKKNRGLVYTFNEMLTDVIDMNGEYWSWLASDDELFPDFVSTHQQVIESSQADVTWSDFRTQQGTETRHIFMDIDPSKIAKTLKQKVCVSLASICVRIEILYKIKKKYGCFCSPKFKHMNDWDFLIKLASITDNFVHIPKALSIYHIHEDMGSSGVYFGKANSEAAKQFLIERAEMMKSNAP